MKKRRTVKNLPHKILDGMTLGDVLDVIEAAKLIAIMLPYELEKFRVGTQTRWGRRCFFCLKKEGREHAATCTWMVLQKAVCERTGG